MRFDDGLTPDEAVAVALWNNAALQISVSDLGFARADLLEAGVLTNPVLSLLFPVGPRQFEATLRLPIEVLWERPRRIAAARLALDASAQQLVQAGLDLVASVRVAYADFSLAIDREQIAKEASALLARIDTLTQSRLSAGDISALEAAAARIDAARAAHDARRAAHDVEIARQRLIALMGQPAELPPFTLTAPASDLACGPAADLQRQALAARPDARPAEIGVVSGSPARSADVAARTRRRDLFALRRLPLELPGGGYAPLESVADVTVAPTPNEITREGGSRRIDVTSNVRGRDLGAVARDIEAPLRNVRFDPGDHPEVLGEYAARAESQRRLLGRARRVATRAHDQSAIVDGERAARRAVRQRAEIEDRSLVPDDSVEGGIV